MTDAPPGWYPDPARQHAVRYWDGSTWTEHASTPAAAPVRAVESGARRLGWSGLVLCLAAIVAVAVPALVLNRINGTSIELDGSTQRLSLAPDTRYGIYVDDVDNSGYSSSCSVADSAGVSIPLSDPGFTISSSDTASLDHVFDSGTGQVRIICSAPGETVSTQQLEPVGPLAIGIVVAGLFGSLGVALSISWLVKAVQRRRTARTGVVPVVD